jgi:hypothetical protein
VQRRALTAFKMAPMGEVEGGGWTRGAPCGGGEGGGGWVGVAVGQRVPTLVGRHDWILAVAGASWWQLRQAMGVGEEGDWLVGPYYSEGQRESNPLNPIKKSNVFRLNSNHLKL